MATAGSSMLCQHITYIQRYDGVSGEKKKWSSYLKASAVALTLALKVETSCWSTGIRAMSTDKLEGQLSSPKMSNTESSARETTHKLLSFEMQSLREAPTTCVCPCTAVVEFKLILTHWNTL